MRRLLRRFWNWLTGHGPRRYDPHNIVATFNGIPVEIVDPYIVDDHASVNYSGKGTVTFTLVAEDIKKARQ